MPAKVTSTGLYLISSRRSFPVRHQLPEGQLQDLPAACGVYIFRDARRRPLYIGKSVNIHARVAQHLRDGAQADMLELARHVQAIETAGEIGALLQELLLVRRYQPPFNVMLREEGEPWVLARDGLRLFACRVSAAGKARVAAAYASRARAEAALENMLRQERLCPGLAGLESIHPERGCFSHQIRRCDGACIGAQSLPAYRRRLSRAMLKLEQAHWPWKGPVGLLEERAGLRQVHLIDRWDYLGSTAPGDAVPRAYRGFDADVYRIVAPALTGMKASRILLQS